MQRRHLHDVSCRHRTTVDGPPVKLVVVTPGSGWILDTIGKSIANAGSWPWLECGTEGNAILHGENLPQPQKPSLQDTEAFFYWDVQSCWGSDWRRVAPQALHVGAFTHLDGDSDDSFRPHWGQLDGVVHMCRRYYDRFLSAGWYPANRMAVIPPGQVIDRFPLRPLRLGVCQRGGFPGKGDPFLFEALSQLPIHLRRHVRVIIKGSWWDRSCIERMEEHPLFVEVDRSESPGGYQDFYRKIDYLLIPSLWEGGPMALIEALACGVPVIAANVGWVPEFLGAAMAPDRRVYNATGSTGSFVFPPGDQSALQSIVATIVDERLRRREAVEGLSWKSYAEKLEAFVETLR